MRTRLSFRAELVLLSLLFAIVLTSSLAVAGKKGLEIEPGPRKMTAAERAIEPDPARRIEHGVILLHEMEWDQSDIFRLIITSRQRAKVLTNEARGLGDIDVPFVSEAMKVKRFWAFAILPDGTVHELAEDDLAFQVEEESRRASSGSLRGSLPGIEPGSVIEWGYELRVDVAIPPLPVVIQEEWPVLERTYRWKPAKQLTSAYSLSTPRGGELDMDIDVEDGAVILRARNLPPRIDEPYAPPQATRDAALWCYYRFTSAQDSAQFWTLAGKEEARALERFSKGREVRKAIDEMGLPRDASLDQKLRHAYDWLLDNVENTSLRSVGEREKVLDPSADDVKDRAKHVLRKRLGTGSQLDKVFVAFARELGAEANIVRVVDRSEGFWNPMIFSTWQFDGSVVAVRPKGAGLDAITMVDPGSGLPYGLVPWWFTGAQGVLMQEEGYRVVTVPPSEPATNASLTTARVELEEGGELFTASWSREGRGQRAYRKRRLRQLTPADLQERLYDACGAGGSIEVLAAEAPGLDDLQAPYRITCEAEAFTGMANPEVTHYSFSVGGPWLEPMPDIGEPPRTHAVVFSFPRRDVTELHIEAPPGMVPGEPPPPVQVDSPFGSYRIEAQPTETGFHVTRTFTLSALFIPPEKFREIKRLLDEARRGDDLAVVFEREDL